MLFHDLCLHYKDNIDSLTKLILHYDILNIVDPDAFRQDILFPIDTFDLSILKKTILGLMISNKENVPIIYNECP